MGIYNGDRLTQSVPVQIRIKTFESFIVAARDIKRGELLTEDDIVIITDESTNFNNDLVADKALIVGMESRIPIQTGKPVKLQDVVEPVLVRRGESIDVEIERGGIVILCKGVAQKDARAGDTIPIKRTNRNQLLYVTVVSESKIIVQ